MTHINYNQIIYENPPILQTNKKMCLIKFQTGQYMGHAQKTLTFVKKITLKSCPICNLSNVNTWLHVLLNCKYQHIRALIKKKTQQSHLGIAMSFYFQQNIKILVTYECGFNGLPQENT